MPKTNRGQYGDLLRRYLNMVGQSDVAEELAPELTAVLTLESQLPEWEFLKGNRLNAHTVTAPAAGAGNFGTVRYRNPPGSGMVAIVTRVVAAGGFNAALNPVTIVVTFGAQLADRTTISGTANRDGRQTPIGGALIASFDSTNVGAGGNAIASAPLKEITPWVFIDSDSPVVITPGFAMTVAIGQQNQDLIVSAQWVEKRLDELERQ